jgi:hypothetical protein
MRNLSFYYVQFHFLFISIVFFSSCASNFPKMNQGKISYSKIIHFNLSKDDLYKYCLSWVSSNFKGIQKLEFSNYSKNLNNARDKSLGSKLLVNTIISEGSYKIQGLSKTEIRYICKIECKENKAKITFSDFHYFVENVMQSISWDGIDRKIKKKLVSQLDSYLLDFSGSESYEYLKFDW